MRTPCSPFDQVGGMVYFARMLDKIRLSASGRLHHDFRQNIGIGFDGRCTRYLHVDHAMLVDRVLEGGSDEEILEWCFANGRRLNQEEIFVWNQFMTKHGWRDDASEELEEYKKSSGLSHRSDLSTFLSFLKLMKGVAHNRSQLFTRSHNETLTVDAMRVEIDKGVLVLPTAPCGGSPSTMKHRLVRPL